MTRRVRLNLEDLSSPCLLLERKVLMENLDRLFDRFRGTDVTLRPHMKTAKSLPVARLVHRGEKGPITVSTLKEAQVFAEAGFTDIIYAVQIAPQKLDVVTKIRRSGVDLKILLDCLVTARAVHRHVERTGDRIPCLIEIDVDGHRGGISPFNDELLLAVTAELAACQSFAGVLSHAGESYNLSSVAALREAAELERQETLRAVDLLAKGGYHCPIVSIGSSPTALYLEDTSGITEVRAGVYMFGDLAQANIGSCTIDNIALSVLTTVISHQPAKGWILIDAGWMALSGDRSTATQSIDYGYGQVCTLQGKIFADLLVIRANQEHGVIALRPGSEAVLPELPVGTLLRILPNHACATAAMHDRFRLVEGEQLLEDWPRFGGWDVDVASGTRVRVLGQSEAAAEADRRLAADAVGRAFIALADGEAELAPVVNVSIPERSAAFSIKAGVNLKGGVVGFKVGTYWPNNEQDFGIPNHASTTLLLDPASGRLRSLLNTSSLNGLRTAAANALATSVLARDDASVLFVAGAGHQARYEIRALCDVRQFRRIVIWSRNRKHAEALALEFADLPGVEFSVVDAADAGAQQADIIVTVTASRRPLFSAQSVRSGTHISAMGADMQGKQELDPSCLLTARLVADWPPQSVSVGEFQHVCNTGARSVDEIVALGDILAGRKPGRLRSDEVTVFDSSGVAIQDLEIADNVLNSAARNGRGQSIEF